MIFSSLIDAYAISVGLMMYTIMYEILASTGIIFWGFIRFYMKFGTEVGQSAGEDWSTKSATPSMVVNTLVMVFTLGLFIAPIIPLQVNDIHRFQNSCDREMMLRVGGLFGSNFRITDTNPAFETTSNAGSDLRNSLEVTLGEQRIQMPVMLLVVMRLAQGLTNTVEYRLPCNTNLTFLTNSLNASAISDRNLLTETRDFMRWCYNPAVNKASRRREYDPLESGWPGAILFMGDDYYRNSHGDGFYSRRPIAGYTPTTNNIPEAADLPPDMGFPTCFQWWNGDVFQPSSSYNSSASLAYRLMNEIDERLVAEKAIVHRQARSLGLAGHSEDASLLRFTFFTPQKMDHLKTNLVDSYARSGVGSRLASIAGLFGAGSDFLAQGGGAYMIQLAAPVIKPFLIAVILFAAPVAFILSSYSLKVIGVTYMFIASVMFWPAIWGLGRVLEATLFDALNINPMIDVASSVFDPGGAVNKTTVSLILKFTTWAFFVFAPIIFSSVLSWAGLSGGGLAQVMSGETSRSGSAGKSGSQKLQGAGKKGMKKGMSKPDEK